MAAAAVKPLHRSRGDGGGGGGGVLHRLRRPDLPSSVAAGQQRAPLRRLSALLPLPLLLLPSRASSQAFDTEQSKFGVPSVPSLSATCAAVEFSFSGNLKEVYVFAKTPGIVEFLQWGDPLPVRRIRGYGGAAGPPMYRALMRNLPNGTTFQVKLSDTPTLLSGDISQPSKETTSLASTSKPVAPSDLQIHRTDLRLNHRKHDESVCVDLHWSHPHPLLRQEPDDVYFRIKWHGLQEPSTQYCEDTVGETTRTCGGPLSSVTSALPSSYATVCGLRPHRNISFSVEAFNCDMESRVSDFQAVTPTTAPDVVMTKVTAPPNQESIAGFRPMAVLDWIPQENPLIEGHAVYLGLVNIQAIRLLCYVPRGVAGHLELPIEQYNYTYAEDTKLLNSYSQKHEVHQEQELIVATRTACMSGGKKMGYHLESPASYHRLGSWLVLTDAVKCLTSFESVYPSYVSRPVTPSLTQEEALSQYNAPTIGAG